MADSMEGVVTDGEPPKTENVELKTVAGKSALHHFVEHGQDCPLSV